MRKGLTIRDCNKNDYYQMAQIRFQEQSMGFVPLLGSKFYTELLRGICESRWGFGKVCINERNKVVGFVFASTCLDQCYLDLLFHRGLSLFFCVVSKLIKNPHLIWGITKYASYPKSTPFKNIKAEWLSMVVKKEYRKIGLGKEFTTSIIKEYKKRKVKQFKSTVPAQNKISCSIHEKFGFKLIGQYELHYEKINIYKYKL